MLGIRVFMGLLGVACFRLELRIDCKRGSGAQRVCNHFLSVAISRISPQAENDYRWA